MCGDRPYRHEERLWKPRSSRAGDVETRSLWRRPFYFSRTTRRPHKNRLVRWTRGVSVHEKIGMGAVHLAFHRRWRCDDQHRSDGLIFSTESIGECRKQPGVRGWPDKAVVL